MQKIRIEIQFRDFVEMALQQPQIRDAFQIQRREVIFAALQMLEGGHARESQFH